VNAEQQYYRLAGYLALPAIAVPLIQLHVFHIFSYEVFFFFGTVGLVFGVSGIWKGERRGRICAAIALLLYAYLAMFFLSTSAIY
jgi:hypothetical protein